MTWSVPWPSTVEQHLLWSQVALVWAVANYGAGEDPVGRTARLAFDERAWLRAVRLRSLVAAALIAVLPGLTWSQIGARLALVVVALLGLAALPRLRRRLSRPGPGPWAGRAPECEVLVNLAFLAATGIMVGAADLQVTAFVSLPVSSPRLTAVCASAAAVVFLFRGGTYLVRGVLDRANALPQTRPPKPAAVGCSGPIPESGPHPDQVDLPEYNRGRTIGNIERFVLLLFVVAGSYEALGLLVAAKGLIRAREFEDRDFAEYFIVGSLVSAAVALVVGIVLRTLLLKLW